MNQEVITKNWIVSNTQTELHKVHDREKNIAVYNRDITTITQEIEVLVNESVAIRASGDIELISNTIVNELKEYALIKNDVIALLHIFKNITKAKTFRLWLSTVNTNMCRRFHTDINDLRLLCTYNGPGTLWLTDDNVNREALHNRGDNQRIVIDDTKIKQAKTGSVVILKGAKYPIEGTNAIVHRSPTIEESNQQRLLLRIDTDEFLNFN